MLYSYIVKKRIRQSFDHLNNHRWDEVLKAVAPNVHHRLPGANALAGERHDKETCGTATLLNGDASYFNRGLQVITLRWGRIYAVDVFEDSQEAARGLAAQAAAGLKEAVAEPIVS